MRNSFFNFLAENMSILKRVFPAVCAFIPLVTFWYFFGLPIEEVFQHTNLAFSKMTIVGIIFGVILFIVFKLSFNHVNLLFLIV